MSKSSLRKELATLSQAQLIDIITDAYCARPEFKEYFEFFLNPDVDKLFEKYEKIITKELNRTKWGQSKARVSVFKKLLKEFAGFNPGPEPVFNFKMRVLRRIGLTEKFVDLTPTQIKYIGTLVGEIITFSNENQMADRAIAYIQSDIDNPIFTNLIRRTLAEALRQAL